MPRRVRIVKQHVGEGLPVYHVEDRSNCEVLSYHTTLESAEERKRRWEGVSLSTVTCPGCGGQFLWTERDVAPDPVRWRCEECGS